MEERLVISQYAVQNYLACRRRFQLRYGERLPWPIPPRSDAIEDSFTQGRGFHRLVERHFLGLDVDPAAIDDPTVRLWWETFRSQGPQLPAGERFPELALTVPVGRHLLTGRFDLLILAQNATAHIFDWKTGIPLGPERLRRSWQTRLYLGLLAEGGGSLPGRRGRPLDPDHMEMTYWYLAEPDRPRKLPYSRALHRQNWSEIEGIVAEMEALAGEAVWPLTDNLSECRFCAYQALCGRQAAGYVQPEPDDEEEALLFAEDASGEPQWK